MGISRGQRRLRANVPVARDAHIGENIDRTCSDSGAGSSRCSEFVLVGAKRLDTIHAVVPAAQNARSCGRGIS